MPFVTSSNSFVDDECIGLSRMFYSRICPSPGPDYSLIWFSTDLIRISSLCPQFLLSSSSFFSCLEWCRILSSTFWLEKLFPRRQNLRYCRIVSAISQLFDLMVIVQLSWLLIAGRFCRVWVRTTSWEPRWLSRGSLQLCGMLRASQHRYFFSLLKAWCDFSQSSLVVLGVSDFLAFRCLMRQIEMNLQKRINYSHDQANHSSRAWRFCQRMILEPLSSVSTVLYRRPQSIMSHPILSIYAVNQKVVRISTPDDVASWWMQR